MTIGVGTQELLKRTKETGDLRAAAVAYRDARLRGEPDGPAWSAAVEMLQGRNPGMAVEEARALARFCIEQAVRSESKWFWKGVRYRRPPSDVSS